MQWGLPILAAVLASLAGCAASENDGGDLSDDQKILNQLEFGTKHSKLTRPPPDYNTTNVVYINFVVLKILDIDEVSQSMSLEGFTELAWTDRRLAWVDKFNGTYNNVSNIYLPRSSVWIPDVVTMNTLDRVDHKFLSFFAAVKANGFVYMGTPFGSKTLCDINMRFFPFDTQTCKVTFSSWQMSKMDIELRALTRNISEFAFTSRQSYESDEYSITKSEFTVTPREKAESFQKAEFAISIQRKPLFYVMNLILPSFLILIICVFSVFLPPESGERLSLNITMMLALTVFLQIVADSTPAQSENVPILTQFFSAVVVFSAVSTIGSMFHIYCYFRGQASPTVGNAAIRLVFLWRLGGGSSRRGASGIRMESANFEVESPDEELRAPGNKRGELGEGEADPCVRDTKPQGESEWHTVGRRLDNCLFITMVIATAALGLFIGLIRNPDYVTG